ncbi:MAG: DUF1343 domain-containing protein [Acidobacteria bacterium]|nr:DUF1343 domain-containing protein [Acidobacteriota bacterium]
MKLVFSRIHAALLMLSLVVLLLTGASVGWAQQWPTTATLDALIGEAVADSVIPGAVLVVGHRGRIVHRKAYGFRALQPAQEAMTLDTVFDCASLTKVVATAPSVMQLLEQGKLRLDDRLTKHLSKFAEGKSDIRIRDLLTHYSGLRPDLDLQPEWSGYETGVRKAYEEVPVAPPGSRFVYSDINYLLLAEVIRELSGLRLDEYAAKHIFEPLEMTESRFNPEKSLAGRIAPTERLQTGEILRGVVHDPTSRYMGGVAGHAGLFSTADDLARFAQMMSNGGRLGAVRVLSPLAVAQMTSPQSPLGKTALRGLGWDLESPYASVRGDLFPAGSYGHTGFTGTSIWIDPATETFVILMTNRVHPKANTSVVSLRAQVANIVAGGIEQVDAARIRGASFARYGQAAGAAARRRGATAQVLSGLDVLVRDQFEPLRGKRVGLITNQTGIDREGRSNIDLFSKAPGVTLAAIFSPEHGLEGRLDEVSIADGKGSGSIPVFSLYQPGRRRPTAEMLQDIDVLVFDIQDIGARFYTYITTMGYAMEEAAKHGKPFYVLDRPNPITGSVVEGPLLDAELRSFIGYFPMPIRHGMTAGELARMFNNERSIGADLHVIPLEGWSREQWFDETGLPWVNPSPNIRTLQQAILYPGVAMLEGLKNYSVGRGTDTPFEFIGADWIEGRKLAAELRGKNLEGLRFYAAERTPGSSRFAGRAISGVQINVIDRATVRATHLGLEIAAALIRLYPDQVRLEETKQLLGNAETQQALLAGRDTNLIRARWDRDRQTFLAVRQLYLLY